MKALNNLHLGSLAAVPMSALVTDSLLPRLDESLDELGAWRARDLRRDEDRPDSPSHLLAGIKLVFKTAQTARLVSFSSESLELRRLTDELTALMACFAPREEIQATLRKLSRLRNFDQEMGAAFDPDEVLLELGVLFDELAVRYNAALYPHPRGRSRVQ